MEKVLFDIREDYISKFFPDKDIVSYEDLARKIEDLEDELEYINQQYEDLKKDVEDNYIPRKNGDIDMYGC